MQIKNFIILFFILFASCKKNQESTTPKAEKITEIVYASGIIKSKNQYEVFSKTNGIVMQIFVTENQSVTKGEPILSISNPQAELNVENAKITADYSAISANKEKLKELQTTVDITRKKMEFDADLYTKQNNLWLLQIGSENELKQRELNYKNSTSTYESAIEKLKEVKKQIEFQDKQSKKNLEIFKNLASDYIIKSQTNGKVYSILKEPGEMINTQNPIALIGDANDFLLELQVDEYDVEKIKTGQRIYILMDSYKGQIFEATITLIKPLMNVRTKTFTVEGLFIKKPPTLFPNLTCEANIVIQSKENAVTIPRSYLLEDEFVLLENKSKKKIITGLKDYQKVEVISGITTSDVIIKPAP
jgi:HlyD family secretion protein